MDRKITVIYGNSYNQKMTFRMHFGSKANKKSSKSEKKFGLFKPFDTTKSDDSKDTSNALNTASTSSRSLSNPKFTVPASKSITTHHKRMHEEALAQDPSIFDYDAVYDTIHAPKPSNTSQKLSSTQKVHKHIVANCNLTLSNRSQSILTQ